MKNLEGNFELNPDYADCQCEEEDCKVICETACLNSCECSTQGCQTCQCSTQGCQTCQPGSQEPNCQCEEEDCKVICETACLNSCECSSQGCQSCQCSTQGCQSCQCSTQSNQAPTGSLSIYKKDSTTSSLTIYAQWTGRTNPIGAVIEFDGVQGVYWDIKERPNPGYLQHTFTGLTPNSYHTAKIRVFDDYGVSEDTWSGNTDSIPIPTGSLSIYKKDSTVSSLTIYAQWTGMTNPASAVIEFDGVQSVNWDKNQRENPGYLQHTFTGLTPNSEHTAKITVFDYFGKSEETWSGYTNLVLTPEAPTNIKAAVNKNSVTISFTKGKNADKTNLSIEKMINNSSIDDRPCKALNEVPIIYEPCSTLKEGIGNYALAEKMAIISAPCETLKEEDEKTIYGSNIKKDTLGSSFTITNLDYSQQYSFKLQSQSNYGQVSNWTSQQTFTTDTPVSSVRLKTGAIALDKGEKFIIKYTISPENATNKSVSFYSSDSSIAYVEKINNQYSVVATNKAGECTITIKSDDNNTYTDTLNVIVKPIGTVSTSNNKVTEFTISTDVTLTGDATNIIAHYYRKDPVNNTYGEIKPPKEIRFTGTKTLTFENLTPDSEYKIQITALKGNLRVADAKELNLKTNPFTPAASIQVNIPTSLKRGRNVMLMGNVTPTNATFKNIEFSSNNAAVASIDKNGKLVANAVGKCTITANLKQSVYANDKVVTEELQVLPFGIIALTEPQIISTDGKGLTLRYNVQGDINKVKIEYDDKENFNKRTPLTKTIGCSSGILTVNLSNLKMNETYTINALGYLNAYNTPPVDSVQRDLKTTVIINDLILNQLSYGKISSASDAKFYKFTSTTSGDYTVITKGSINTFCYVYDSNFNLIAKDNDGDINNSSIEVYLEKGKTIYIEVRPWDAESGIGDYSIRITNELEVSILSPKDGAYFLSFTDAKRAMTHTIEISAINFTDSLRIYYCNKYGKKELSSIPKGLGNIYTCKWNIDRDIYWQNCMSYLEVVAKNKAGKEVSDKILCYVTSAGEQYYYDTDKSWYYNTPNSHPFKGISQAVLAKAPSHNAKGIYNCLAYAVGIYDRWQWPWGKDTPNQENLKDYFSSTSKYNTITITETPEKFKTKAIYYDGDHFAKVLTYDDNGNPKKIRSKWGPAELIESSNYNPFTDLYGKAKYFINSNVEAEYDKNSKQIYNSEDYRWDDVKKDFVELMPVPTEVQSTSLGECELWIKDHKNYNDPLCKAIIQYYEESKLDTSSIIKSYYTPQDDKQLHIITDLGIQYVPEMLEKIKSKHPFSGLLMTAIEEIIKISPELVDVSNDGINKWVATFKERISNAPYIVNNSISMLKQNTNDDTLDKVKEYISNIGIISIPYIPKNTNVESIKLMEVLEGMYGENTISTYKNNSDNSILLENTVHKLYEQTQEPDLGNCKIVLYEPCRALGEAGYMGDM